MPTAIQSILEKTGLDAMLLKLDALPPNQVQSVLLGVFERLALRTPASQLLAKYEQNRFVQPGRVPPQRMLQLEKLAYSLLPEGVKAVQLSPAGLLGGVSAFGCVSQHKVVSACRGVELISDATNALALECARRRKRAGAAESVHLCAAHRLMRAQKYQSPGSLPHFEMFSMCSAGRDAKGATFEADALAMHMRYHLALLRAVLGSEAGFVLKLSTFGLPKSRAIAQAAVARLGGCQEVDVRYADEASGGGYYDGLRFQIGITKPDGSLALLSDGGLSAWGKRLLSDQKELMMTSGTPLEALAFMTA